jgi:hypothetical protein
MKTLVLISLLLGSLPAFSQEYIYPNKLLSDKGLIEYRRYSLEEARAIEIGDNNVTPHNPFLLDWGPERRIAEVPDPYAPKLAVSGDSIYCAFSTVGSIQSYFIKSSDAGVSWSQYMYLGDTSVVSLCLFPEIVLNGNNLIVGFKGQEAPYGENLFWRSSTDRGDSWSSLYQVFPYWINSFSNYSSLTNSGRTLYFSYIEYIHDSLYVLKSTNWGQSWNGRGVNVAYLNSTPQPMTIRASGSNIYLVWVSEAQGVGIRYSRSTNGGQSWSEEYDLAADSIGSQEVYISVDGSHVAISWMGYKYSPYMFTGDLFIRQSFDNGATWDSAQVLTDSHRVWMGSTYIKDSLLVATWQDLRFSDENNSEVYVRFSTDYGVSWTQEERISFGDNDSDSPIAASTQNTIHIIWGDRRPQASGLYYRMYDPNYDAIRENPDIPDKPAILSAYPNPFNTSVTINYSSNETDINQLNICNILGESIKTIKLKREEGKAVWDGKDDNHNPVSSGVYFAKISASGKDKCVKLVLLK